MDITQTLLQNVIVVIFAGIFAQVIAERVKMPSVVILMLLGFVLGPHVLALVNPSVLGEGMEVLVSLSVAWILFEGSLSLDMSSFKAVNQSVRNMVSIGILITVFATALAVKLLIGLNWSLSLLFGCFMSITGLTAINPILQRVRIKKNIGTILKSEGILSDPIGAILAVLVLEVMLTAKYSLGNFFYAFATKIFFGSIFGFVMGWIIGRFLKHKYVSDDLKNLVLLAWVLGTFYLSNLIQTDSGILAVVSVGIAVQRENIPQLKTLKRFGGQLSILFISILFILISANLDISNLIELGLPGLAVVLITVLLVRPLSVFLSNWGLLGFREKLFISWIGPKGIVSASVAALFSLILAKNGIEDGRLLESLVFFTILVTVLGQGLSAHWAAKLCGVLIKSGGVIIVGANALGRTLGTAFRELGQDVVLIDSNIDHCKEAALDDLETVFGNALDNSVLESAQVYNVDTLITTTANSEINFLVCQMCKEEYKVPHLYPSIDSPDKGVHQKLVDEIGGNLAYAKPVSIEVWKQAINDHKVQIIEWELTDKKGGLLCDLAADSMQNDEWLPLILKTKNNNYFFAHSDQVWEKGDVLICLSRTLN